MTLTKIVTNIADVARNGGVMMKKMEVKVKVRCGMRSW